MHLICLVKNRLLLGDPVAVVERRLTFSKYAHMIQMGLKGKEGTISLKQWTKALNRRIVTVCESRFHCNQRDVRLIKDTHMRLLKVHKNVFK